MLSQLSYKQLRDSIRKHSDNLIEATPYSDTYIQKAKKIKDTSKLASGYYYKLNLNKDRFDLYDTIIHLTEHSSKLLNFPTIAYFDKSNHYLNDFQYDKALSNLIKASQYNKGSNKEYLQYLIDSGIADIKLRIGNNEEALSILKRTHQYSIENNFETKNFTRYALTMINLGNAHRKLNHIDTAKKYIDIGIVKSKKEKHIQKYFKLTQSIIELEYSYNPEIFNQIENTITYFDSIGNPANVSIAHYYSAKAHLRNNNYEEAIHSFKKVDSSHNIDHNIILPETVDTYKYLRDYYNSKNDSKKELNYINKYLRYDSILNSNYKSISNSLKKEYDLPLLLKDRELIIKELEKEKKTSRITFYSVLFLLLILTITSAILYYRHKKQKNRIKELLSSSYKKLTVEKKKNNTEKLKEWPQELIKKIDHGILKLENENFFLDNKINATLTAKKLGTNTSYFLKIFHQLYGEKFNIYLSKKRTSYAFERLKSDKIFRRYTIKSIARDSGFGSAESFSKHFYKEYGVYPSKLIKTLENN